MVLRKLCRGDVAEFRRRTLFVDHEAAFFSMWADVPAELRPVLLEALDRARPGEDLLPLAEMDHPPRIRIAAQTADLAFEGAWTIDRVFTAWLALNRDRLEEHG